MGNLAAAVAVQPADKPLPNCTLCREAGTTADPHTAVDHLRYVHTQVLVRSLFHVCTRCKRESLFSNEHCVACNATQQQQLQCGSCKYVRPNTALPCCPMCGVQDPWLKHVLTHSRDSLCK
jgi:hypothetical protein